MNTLLPYEQGMAEKLNHIIVPDMEDEIWANIEQQLALEPDLLSSEAPTANSDPFSLNIRPTSLKLFTITTVLFTLILFMIYRKYKTVSRNNSMPIQMLDSAKKTDRLTPYDSVSVEKIFELKHKKPVEDIRQVADSPLIKNYPIIILPSITDSTSNKAVLIPKKQNDSVVQQFIPDLPIPVKRGKGVKGIKDSDYKIMPVKKDTL